MYSFVYLLIDILCMQVHALWNRGEGGAEGGGGGVGCSDTGIKL